MEEILNRKRNIVLTTYMRPCPFVRVYSTMGSSNTEAAAMIVSLLCSFIAASQLTYIIANRYSRLYYRRRYRLFQLLMSAGPTRAKICRRTRTERRFWVRSGRSRSWWDNFIQDFVVQEEWKENFRKKKENL